MYDFMQNYMNVSVVTQVGKGNNAFEIEPVAVNIPGYDDLPM
jgi:hypothetical protein